MNTKADKYVASVEDIRKLARENLNSQLSLASTRKRYFELLLGTTTAQIKAAGDDDAKKPPDVLKAVHKEFYAAVLEIVATPELADVPRLSTEERKRRAKERNQKSNYARSAFGTIRKWMKAPRHDITALNPAAVKESQLRKETPNVARKISAKRTSRRVNTLVKGILKETRLLLNANPEEARAILGEVANKVTQELFTGDVTATTQPDIATKESRPLRLGKNLFWPTAARNGNTVRAAA